LFVDRARGVRPEFELSAANAVAVAQLCLRLDGLPLALELAAARVRLLTVDAILDRVERSLDVLKAQPGTALPERHRTLRAAIDWSYALLTDDERDLFTRLAVFVGGFSLAAAEAVGVASSFDVADGVESLLDHSLLRIEPSAAGEPRFGMLETVREYARERLVESPNWEAARRRHARFYLRLAEQAEPGLRGSEQVSWLERLDAERDNIRAALRWAIDTGKRSSAFDQAQPSGATGSSADARPRGARRSSACSRRDPARGSRGRWRSHESQLSLTCKVTASLYAASARNASLYSERSAATTRWRPSSLCSVRVRWRKAKRKMLVRSRWKGSSSRDGPVTSGQRRCCSRMPG
jgi:predicted ATPase